MKGVSVGCFLLLMLAGGLVFAQNNELSPGAVQVLGEIVLSANTLQSDKRARRDLDTIAQVGS